MLASLALVKILRLGCFESVGSRTKDWPQILGPFGGPLIKEGYLKNQIKNGIIIIE